MCESMAVLTESEQLIMHPTVGPAVRLFGHDLRKKWCRTWKRNRENTQKEKIVVVFKVWILGRIWCWKLGGMRVLHSEKKENKGSVTLSSETQIQRRRRHIYWQSRSSLTSYSQKSRKENEMHAPCCSSTGAIVYSCRAYEWFPKLSFGQSGGRLFLEQGHLSRNVFF